MSALSSVLLGGEKQNHETLAPTLWPSARHAFHLRQGLDPEEALAVFELLEDLRECIWQHYQIPIQTLVREQGQTNSSNDWQPEDANDPPF